MIPSSEKETQRRWEESFAQQIAQQAYNMAPVEAVVRTLAYHFRERFSPQGLQGLHFLEMGCGAGPNLVWLAQKGIRVSGIDISPRALGLAREVLTRYGLKEQIGQLLEGSVTNVPFANETFDGLIEACVFQHLSREERQAAFGEVRRLLKPGGLFVGYLLSTQHTVFKRRASEELKEDPGTLILSDGNAKFHLTNIGISHFFRQEEFLDLLKGFSLVDAAPLQYTLPILEARKRGYDEYIQAMWTVYAVK